MSTTDSVRDDLAYLRAIVEHGEGNYRPLGEGYLAGGICYGGQMVLQALQGLGVIPKLPLLSLAIGIGPTVVFLIALVFIVRRNRRFMYAQGSFVARAVGAMFAAIGLSNFALIIAISSVALRLHSLTVWLIYPCTVFVLQGAAWLAVFMLRKQLWHGLVAAGWFASAIVMAISIERLDWFVLVAGLALCFCMALPGWVILRQASQG